MCDRIHTYIELRVQIREALRRQHPEWIDADGKSPLCDSYEARFAKLLAAFTRRRANDEPALLSTNYFHGHVRDQPRRSAWHLPSLTDGGAANCSTPSRCALPQNVLPFQFPKRESSARLNTLA